MEGGKITTCGDANSGIADQPIVFSDVIGRYIKTSAVLTFFYTMFRSKFGFALVVFIPLVVLLIIQFVNFVQNSASSKVSEKVEETPEEAVKQKEDEIRRKAIEEYLASIKPAEDEDRKKK